MTSDNMEDKLLDFDEKVSKMFTDKKGALSVDEQLALHIIHRFNICRDTLETMPAFEEHLETFFCKEKEK